MPPVWIPYCGAAPLPAELMARWNFDPVLILGLALLGFGYARSSTGFATDRKAACVAAMATAAVLFVSPFCALSSALFSVRVTHHVVLTAVVAPLIVKALPRERLRVPGTLALWTAVQALLFWLWHAPSVYAWALSSDAAYWLMQLTLLISATGFWARVRQVPAPAGAAALLVTMVQMGLLGALITFAGTPLYAPHLLATAAWGLSPLEDQQLAGLIMWAPAAAFYLAAALLLINRWMGSEQRRALAS